VLARVNLQQAVCRLVHPAVGSFLVQPLQQLRFVRAELGERLMHCRTHDLQLLRPAVHAEGYRKRYVLAAAAINANGAEHVSSCRLYNTLL
jgi:hypothetical protein